MDACKPRERVERRRCAPKHFPCPHCGKAGRRKDTHTRRIRDIAFCEIVYIELTVGEYRADCGCCKTFRSTVDGIEPRAEYTNRVRDVVIDRLLDDQMNMETIQQSMSREFYLNLSDGFLHDCVDWKVRQLDQAEYRQWTVEQFSGTLCVDEVHLGGKTLLVATDPLGDFAVGFAMVSANDKDHMRRFLANLKNHGIFPKVVVTDGSNLYPALLEEIWPEARHQLCIFHIIKDINDCVFDAIRHIRRRLSSRGRRRKRGRLSKSQRRAQKLRAPSNQEKAKFIGKHRHLFVTKPENMTDHQYDTLRTMCGYAPELMKLRLFVLDVYELFDPEQTPHQAKCRRAALVKNSRYHGDAYLQAAMNILTAEKFDKMIAYLHSPAARRVRTNNHVERTNRKLRYLEKVRYKWRRRRTIVRFVILALDRWRKKWSDPSQRRLGKKQGKQGPCQAHQPAEAA